MKSEKKEDKMTIMLSIVRTWRQAHKEFQGNLLEQAYELNDSAELLQIVHKMPYTAHQSETEAKNKVRVEPNTGKLKLWITCFSSN